MDRPLRGVALDCDGVIINSVQYHVTAWQKALKEKLNLEVSAQTIRRQEGVRGIEFIGDIAKDHGPSLSQEQIESIYQYKRTVYHSVFKLSPIPGSADLIKTLFDLESSLGKKYLSQADKVFPDLNKLTSWVISEHIQSHGLGPWKL